MVAARERDTLREIALVSVWTEQKPAKMFEQKAAKLTKGLGSTIYVVVLQASRITARHHF